MDISRWNPNQIMQLPDWCFGNRWWVGEYMGSTTGVCYERIGEELLPQRFVLWGILVCTRSPSCAEAMRLSIRLAGSVPPSVDAWKKSSRLLGDISTAPILFELYTNPNGLDWIGGIKQLVEPNGRRLALISSGDQSNAYEMTVGLLISAVPTEVPDWLIKAGL